MVKSNYTIAIRTLVRQKGYAALNAFGLTLGVTCFVLILLFIQDELSYDRYHEHADRIYRITEDILPTEHSSSQPFSLPPTLEHDFPAMVEHAVRFFNLQAPTLTLESGPDRRFNESRFFFVDSTVFEVFTFPLITGDPLTALRAPYSLVLTEEMARKYFGRTDVLGRTLRFEGKHDLHITGVLGPIPSTSHFHIDFLASFNTLAAMRGGQQPALAIEQEQGWNWNPCWTYLLLTKGTDPSSLASFFPAFVKKYFPDNIRDKVVLHLQPLTDIHLHSHLDFEIEPNSDASYIAIFGVIAGFVLLIACINFMNLATARSARRAREVGMRKVMGAYRSQLIRQFLVESFLMSFLSVLLTLPLVDMALPLLNRLVSRQIVFDPAGNPLLLLSLACVAVIVGFLAGLYPAFVLSAFRPIAVLKGKLYLSGRDWSVVVRKGLVIAQFVVSIVLIIGTLIAGDQLRFMQAANLGFTKDHVLLLNILRANMASRYESFKQRLLQNRKIISVTTTEEVLGSKHQTTPFRAQGHDEIQQFQRLMVGYDFVETFDLSVVAGRSFSKQHPGDDSSAVMINEAMVRYLNWGSPQQALGKAFVGRQRRVVVGVLKDFHYASLHEPIGPFLLAIGNGESQHNFFDRYVAVRIAPGDYRETISYIQQTWSAFLPDRPFQFSFLDNELDNLYRSDERVSRVAGVFSSFAIVVAALGLIGMASFAAQARTKENGIRKILGAGAVGLFMRMSVDFLMLVGVAIAIACPLGYILMQRWLQEFAFRADIGSLPFVVGGGIAIIVAWCAVSYQAMRAARTNPVETLRYE